MNNSDYVIMNATILLVDDDPDDLFILSDAIRTLDHSCEIIEAYDGDAALLLLDELGKRDVVPDLIVVDINMPVLDGRELLKLLKTNDDYKEVPVVMYTTSSNVFDRLHCEQYQVELFIKPSTLESIMQVVGQMLQYCKKRAA
jgi:CheY-like chemotaxis protein